jgi:hypothetical protein
MFRNLIAHVALHGGAISLQSDLQNVEILILTYGSMVRQLVTEYDDVKEVNAQLEKM